MITPNITTVETPRPPAVLGADGSLSLLYPGGQQLLSPAGTIAAVSAVTDASGGTDVYAITTAGHTLWEHTSAGWAEISAGYFQQISAATNSAGNAVVFGILGAGAGPNANSLWEDSSLNPGGWAMLSPGGTILSISAGLNDDVYAITVAGTPCGSTRRPAGPSYPAARSSRSAPASTTRARRWCTPSRPVVRCGNRIPPTASV